MKVVKDNCQQYYDQNVVDGHLSSVHREKIREIIKEEHFDLNPAHRYAKEVMNDVSLDGFIYRLTDRYKKKVKKNTMEKVAEKKAILNVILSDLLENELLIEPGSKESAYVIQCIFVSGLVYVVCLVHLILCLCLILYHVHPRVIIECGTS